MRTQEKWQVMRNITHIGLAVALLLAILVAMDIVPVAIRDVVHDVVYLLILIFGIIEIWMKVKSKR